MEQCRDCIRLVRVIRYIFSPKTARERIITEVFEKLPNRLWLPFHVQYEYLKNREKTIKKPIKDKYSPLKVKIQKIRTSTNTQILKRIDEIKRETEKDDKHPHLEQTLLDHFKKKTEEFLAHNRSFEENILKKIEGVENDDDVLKSLEKYFKIGREFNFEEILEITKEGKHRYEFKIPPGYGDYYSKEKIGTQIFGDLIIWKQILEHSKETKKPIIFITNDITKDNDWCYLDENATEKRISSPREELIKEIKDFSGVDFWMYNLPQFLYESNKRIHSKIPDETIQNYFQFINNRDTKSQNLKLKCNKCNKIHTYHKSDFDLDFEFVSSSERNMGDENQYVSEEELKCNNCGNHIKVKFGVWEYPVGAHNYDDIEIDGAKLLESFHFTVDFFEENEPDFITCHSCSGNRDGGGNFVRLDDEIEVINEYTPENPKSEYKSVVCGNCDWCNTIHIVCPDCNGITEIEQFRQNENIECEGGCGMIFNADSTNDRENLGEFDLRIVDDRLVECESCGNDFIDEQNTNICLKCEEKYNNE